MDGTDQQRRWGNGMNDARTGAIANGGATDDNVDSGPIRVGAMLFTLVDPTPGFEVAYNRWYERDHFYGGVMVGPGTLSGRRWVATRALKDLRFPTEPSGHSPVTNPIDAGSFLATYFIDAASVANHFAWASEEVHKLYAAGRGFEERTHAHTVLYTMRAAHHRDVAPIPAHLALDHPYAGLASIHVDRADGVSTTDLDAARRRRARRRARRGLTGGPGVELAPDHSRQGRADGPGFGPRRQGPEPAAVLS